MSIDQFRENEMLSAGLAELLQNPTLQAALAVCDAASPVNAGTRMPEIVTTQPHMAHVQLGIDRGYNLYPQVLRALATPIQKQEAQIEPTYEEPKEEVES